MIRRSTSALVVAAFVGLAVYLIFRLSPLDFSLLFEFTSPAHWLLFSSKRSTLEIIELERNNALLRNILFVSMFVPYLLAGFAAGLFWPINTATTRLLMRDVLVRVVCSFAMVAACGFVLAMYALALNGRGDR